MDPFVALEGSGSADAYVRTDPKPGQQTWNRVRQNFNNLDERITTMSGSAFDQTDADLLYAPLTKYGATGLVVGQYGNAAEFALGACGAAKTIDWNNGNQQYGTLTANCTFTLTNPRTAHRYAMVLEQAGAGLFSVTFTGVLWMNSAPNTTTGATGAVFLVTFMRTAANSGKYIGSWGLAS
jgi:hypothetical protein